MPVPRPASALAYGLTYTVSPLALPILVAVLGVLALGGTPAQAHTAGLVALVGNGLVPLVVLVALRLSGRVATLEVREQDRRTLPYVAGIAGTLVSAYGLWMLLPEVTGRFMAIATLWQAVNSAVLLLINRRIKVSVHLYALASALAFVAYLRATGHPVAGFWTAGLAALLLPLAWARWRLHAHTPGQMALGAALGLSLLPIELWLSGR